MRLCSKTDASIVGAQMTRVKLTDRTASDSVKSRQDGAFPADYKRTEPRLVGAETIISKQMRQTDASRRWTPAGTMPVH